jgi:hypothetical protein
MIGVLQRYIQRVRRRRARQCIVCGRTLILTRFDTSGSAGCVSVTFHGLPCLSCGDLSHPKRYATPNFGTELMDALYFAERSRFPSSRLKGLGRAQHCFSCGRRLTAAPSSGNVSGRVIAGRAPEFGLSVDAPIVKCVACGQDQVYNTESVSSETNDAIIAAFEPLELDPR